MTDQKENFGIALYYPYIRIQDESWLKCSLLYWDKLRRIAPNELKVERLMATYKGQGLLIDTDPIDYRDEAAEMFKQKFLPAIEANANPDIMKAEQFFNKSNLTIYNTKFCDSIKDDLERKGLIEREGPWYRVAPIVGGYYMISLSSVISKKTQAPMITDTMEYELASQYCIYGENVTDTPSQEKDLIVQLGLCFPDPQLMADVPLKTIITFRDKYQDERMQFRKVIEVIKNSFSQIDDQNARADFLNQKRKEIESAITDHKKALESINIQSIASLKVVVPVISGLIASSAQSLDDLSKAVVAIAGLTISSVIGWTKIRQDKREAIKKCQHHYLLSLEKRFKQS